MMTIEQNGRDLGEKMLDAVKSYVGRSISALATRLDGIEKRLTAIPAGAKGDKGDPGESIVGPKGDAGERGEKGESVIGLVGPAGESIVGPAGESIVGPKGDVGERGEFVVGPQGPSGESIIGPAGESIVGPKGDPGESVVGLAGPAGESIIGPRGERGETGIGIKGIDGRDGRDGKDAREPIDGVDGVDGRDALQIEILDEIDVAKRYPRGTYAKHNGGIVRALRMTDPTSEASELTGWQTVVDGVREIIVVPGADERSFAVQSRLTSGKMVEKTVTLPLMIYRGVWKEAEFQRGDVTTWDGSTWHCEAITSDKPGMSTAWKLCVKRGRDGAQGIGTKGDPGLPGKPGRDGGKY